MSTPRAKFAAEEAPVCVAGVSALIPGALAASASTAQPAICPAVKTGMFCLHHEQSSLAESSCHSCSAFLNLSGWILSYYHSKTMMMTMIKKTEWDILRIRILKFLSLASKLLWKN